MFRKLIFLSGATDDEWNEEYERKFAVRWLTNAICWLHRREAESTLVDRATALLAICSGSSASGEHIRSFKFILPNDSAFTVNIRDGSINSSSTDVLVGVQTWGSAPTLAQMMSSSPDQYLPTTSRLLRVLELGAGTGLVSLAAGRIIESCNDPSAYIVASDYDTTVIENLRSNIARNPPFPDELKLVVSRLDWQDFIIPVNSDKKEGDSSPPVRAIPHDPPFDDQFDVILGADIVYEPHQASWIKAVVSALLRRPDENGLSPTPEAGTVASGSRFHLIIPLRATHEDESASVLATFPPLKSIISEEPAGILSDDEAPQSKHTAPVPPTLTLAMLSSEEIEPNDRRRPMKYFRCEIGWAYM